MRRLCLSLLLLATLAWGEPADWIWSARYVVAMDGARYQPRRRLDRPESLILPGLVNTHTHVPMSLMRGLADDLRLQEWLEKYIFPAEAKNLSADYVRWGTRLGCLEMMLGGITTFAEMYYFEDVVAEATQEAGLRGVLGETIIGFPVADAKTPAEGLRFNERYIQRFRGDPLITPAVAPHALYTNSEGTLRACRALANRYGVPLMIHLAETARERKEALVKWKRSPAAVLDSWGIFSGRTVAAHVVWVDDADLKILKARGVGIAHCPSSNTKLASGIAPVVRMLAAGLAVGLGTDGPAGANNDLNLFEEMDLAAKLQKVTTSDPEALSARQAVEMATLLGARVLGLEKEIGSLEAGKRADLITVRLDAPHAVPLYNVYSQLVYALKACDVADVMVNGRLLVRARQPLTLDARAVLANAAEYGAKVRASLGR